MKLVQTSIFAMAAFFLSTGISLGAELDDLDLTIRVVESDDLAEVHNELSLPDAASEVAREHAEDDDGRGLTQANESRAKERERDKNREDEAREEREDEVADHDEAREDSGDVNEERDEAKEEESHEEEHEKQDTNL